MLEKYREIFRGTYNGDNIEETIAILKNAGITQIDTVKVLMDELSISIRDADDLVLNAIAWKENKATTEGFRNTFADMLRYLDNKN